jgi:hypothetical protein
MRRQLVILISVVTLVCAASLGISFVVTSLLKGQTHTEIRTIRAPTEPKRAFVERTYPGGEVSINVCSQVVPAGTAHCDAEVRFEAASLPTRTPRSDLHTVTPGGVISSTSTGDGGAYSPAYLQSAYNVASAEKVNGGGAGQIVAVVDAYADPNIVKDLAYYRNFFGLATCPVGSVSRSLTKCVFEVVNQSGTVAPLPAPDPSWALETAIDVETVSAMCPNCQILLVETSSSSIQNLGQGVNVAVELGADVVSNSYGSIEYDSETTDSSAYFNHPGVPIVVATNDIGYGVEFPAASNFVVAVGGTTLSQASAKGTRNATESVWSGTGAGCSLYEPKPIWQHDTGCSMRTVADVSALADPETGVWIRDTYQNPDDVSLQGVPGFAIVGGTSVAAAIVSSMFALAGNSDDPSSYPASFLYGNPSALFALSSGSDGTCGTYLRNASDSQDGYSGPGGLGTPGGTPNSIAAFTIPGAPNAPVLDSVLAANSSVTLTWSAPTKSPKNARLEYQIYEGSSPGGESSTPINASPVGQLSYVAAEASVSSEDYFTVKALTPSSTSAASNELRVGQAPLRIKSLRAGLGIPMRLVTSGGQGTGSVSFVVDNGIARGCAVVNGMLTSETIGTCLVTANKAADASNAATSSSVTKIAMVSPARPGSISLRFAPRSAQLSVGVRAALRSLALKLVVHASVVVTGSTLMTRSLLTSRFNAVSAYLRSRIVVGVTLRIAGAATSNALVVSTSRQ